MPDQLYQRDLDYIAHYGSFAGIDEAGRGALAGPVVIAAVVLDYNQPISGLNDSKLIKAKQREFLYQQITATAVAYKIIEVSAEYIDLHNIRQASISGFYQAFMGLQPPSPICLIDGKDIPLQLVGQARAVIKGDSLHAAIAAASILAKVHRDKLMTEFDVLYPQYGFAKHKGYGTVMHCRMVHSFGRCPIHRCSFNVPVL